MSEEQPNYLPFVGRVAFPRGPEDLLSTTACPACFSPLRSTVCGVCGLDLNHPAAAALRDASLASAASLDARLNIIGRMRYETAQEQNRRAMAASAPAPAAVVPPRVDPASAGIPTTPAASVAVPAAIPPSTVTVPSIPPVDGPPRLPSPPLGVATPGGSPAVHRRSSVQVTLLLVGVSLLSVAAIFFLVYAFINYGLIWRSIIIGAITIAAFATASLLRRRRLTATAEGISAFAIVLVYLDAFALRANDFFALGAANGAVYWGTTMVIASTGFILWSRASTIRLPGFAGLIMFAPGVGVLVGGLSEQASAGTQTFLVLASIGAAGAIHRAATGRGQLLAARIIILSTTVAALIAGIATAFLVEPAETFAPTAAALVLAAIALLQVAGLRKTGATTVGRVFSGILSGYAGVATATALAQSAGRVDDPNFWLMAPSISAVGFALLFELAARRGGQSVRGHAIVAAWSAGAVAALALLLPLAISARSSLATAANAVTDAWALSPADAITTDEHNLGWAVLTLAIVTALAAALWGGTGITRSRGSALAWAVGIVAIVATPLLGTVGAAMAGWLLLAAVSFAALLRYRTMTASRTAALVFTLSAAATLGYLLGWASTSTWWIGTLVVLALLLACRRLLATDCGKAALLGAAVTLILGSAPAVARHIRLDAPPPMSVETLDQVRMLGIVAVVLLALSAIALTRRATATDRRVVFWLSGAASAVTIGGAPLLLERVPSDVRASLLFPDQAWGLALAAALLGSLLLWVLLKANRTLRPERIVASIAIGPALYLVVTAFARAIGMPAFVEDIAPVTAALLAAAGALVIAVLRPSTTPRWARELGVTIVAVPAVIAAFRDDDGLAWLVLVLAAVTTLFLAIDDGGLFSSRSMRRHLGWLALALAVAGLWWRLGGDRVADLEPYVLPVTAALLIVAALIWHADVRRQQKLRGHDQPEEVQSPRTQSEPARSAAAPLVALGGLLVSILPLGVNAATGDATRALAVAAVSTVLVVVGSFVVSSDRLRPWLDVAAVGGAIGVMVTTFGRAALVPAADVTRDAWLLAAFLILVACAFGQARRRGDRHDGFRGRASQSLGLVAMAGVLVLAASAVQPGMPGAARGLALILLFSAIHIIAFAVDRVPFTRLLSWVAALFAAIAGVVALSLDVIHPVEVATIPVALALLTTGSLQLSAVASARSWRWLGAGTALLLVPSLIATVEDRPVWRLVGLGVLGVAVIVVAVVRRLQAPFVLGVVVILVHGVATFLPQLRAVYESLPWWLWLGAGGILLIVLAARYEQRIRNLKSVAMRFAALR